MLPARCPTPSRSRSRRRPTKPSRTKAQSEFSKESEFLMLPDAFPVTESNEADDAVPDQGTVEGVVVVRTISLSLPDTFPDKV